MDTVAIIRCYHIENVPHKNYRSVPFWNVGSRKWRWRNSSAPMDKFIHRSGIDGSLTAITDATLTIFTNITVKTMEPHTILRSATVTTIISKIRTKRFLHSLREGPYRERKLSSCVSVESIKVYAKLSSVQGSLKKQPLMRPMITEDLLFCDNICTCVCAWCAKVIPCFRLLCHNRMRHKYLSNSPAF